MNKSTKLSVWSRDNYTCTYCGEKLTEQTATVDHVIPRHYGGKGGNNLVTACKPCNKAKADSIPASCVKIPAVVFRGMKKKWGL